MNGTLLAGAMASLYVALICFRDVLEGVEDRRWGKALFNAACLIGWGMATYNLGVMAFAK